MAEAFGDLNAGSQAFFSILPSLADRFLQKKQKKPAPQPVAQVIPQPIYLPSPSPAAAAVAAPVGGAPEAPAPSSVLKYVVLGGGALVVVIVAIMVLRK